MTSTLRGAWLGWLACLLAFTCLGQTSPPPNDAFTNRTVISGFELVAWGTNTYATAEPGEPAHAGQSAIRSLWWSWVAPRDGVALLTVTNVGVSATLMRWAVYTGDALTNLSLIVSNATYTNRVVQFQAEAGKTYQIAVDDRYAYYNAPFAIVLHLPTTFLTQPAPGARIPAGHPYSLMVTNTEPGNPLSRVDYYASGNWLGSVTEAPFAFDWIPTVPGYTNVSAVATNALGERRDVPAVTVTVTPSNDDFTNAIVLPATAISGSLAGNSTFASAEVGEPVHADKAAARSLWWKWTPAYAGLTEVKIISGYSQPRVAVYTGSALDKLVAVNPSAISSRVVFEAAPGTAYFVVIDSSGSGAFTAALNQTTLFVSQPAAGARIPAGQSCRLMVTNTETDHALTRVDYYASGNWLGSVTEPPFVLDWVPEVSSSTNVSAVATNSLGQRREAPAIQVTVTPHNDNFADAIALPASTLRGSITGNNMLAGAELGEPAHAGEAAEHSLWWKWTPVYSGRASIQILSSPGEPRVVIYTGSALDNLVAVTSTTQSGVPARAGFDAVADTTYFIAIDTKNHTVGGLTAEFALSTLCFLSPANGTRLLAGQPLELVVTNYESDHPLDTLELVMNGSHMLASSWSAPWHLNWATNRPGQYTFNVWGTNSLGELRLSDTNIVMVSPANDDFTNALELASLPNAVVNVESTTMCATHEAGEPEHLDPNARASVWFTWVAPWSGDIQFTTAGNHWYPILVVYRGNALTNLVALTTPYSMVARVEQGQRYYIAMDSMRGSEGPVGFSILPPPLNNNFADAFEFAGTAGSFRGTNYSANSEPGEPVIAPENSASIWWRWTAPETGDFTFTTANSLGMTVQSAVYTGLLVTNLTTVVMPGTASSITFRAYGGTTYYFRFSGSPYYIYGTIGGNYSFTPLPDIPVNDTFTGRLPLTGLTNFTVSDNSLASSALDEPHLDSCYPVGRTLWWSYTAPETGQLSVRAKGLSNEVAVALYRGKVLRSLELVASSCNGPIEIMVQAGDEFAIQVDSAFWGAGRLTLQTVLHKAAPNDNFANSIHLEGTNATVHGDPAACTFEPGEPNPGATNTVWFSWLAPITGRAAFSPAATLEAPMAVYMGAALDQIKAVRLVSGGFLAEQGTVYHFQYAGSGAFDLSLSVSPFEPCNNDMFASAVVLKSLYPGDRRSVVGATLEPGEPPHGGTTPSKSLWWKWQAPFHGLVTIVGKDSLVPEVTWVVYQGTAVEALSPMAKGTNTLSFFATGGETYYLAGVVAADAVGDIAFYFQHRQSFASIPVPGNLLQEPSWEGTALFYAQYWHWSTDIGGYVNEQGGVDGTTWPTIGSGTRLWQDIATVPGQNHAIRFAFSKGTGPIRVTWDGRTVGEVTIHADETSFWHWAEFTAYASNTTSRVQFENLGGQYSSMDMDAFSVVSLSAPPKITTEPASTSVMERGTAAFSVGVNGSAPLTYTWFFNGSVVAVRHNGILTLESVTTNQAGIYQAVVTNAFGAVTSAPVSLVVEALATAPVILWQPYGDTMALGGSHTFSVVAAGTAPLSFQWFKDGVEMGDATNRSLAFLALDLTNAGVYSVRVQNNAGTTWSVGARLVVADVTDGGGAVTFANRVAPYLDAPVFDTDGVTGLSGSNFVAQLYAGPSLELLRPVGQPSPFRPGSIVGYFYSQTVALPNVAPGSNAIVQVRAWDARMGCSYEEARAMGGKFGKSSLLTVKVGGGVLIPTFIDGLQRFSLQAGMPQFRSGEISFVEVQPTGKMVWSHRGEPGFRYLIEKSGQGVEWRPFAVITNTTSTVTFSDTTENGTGLVFYRSRILD